MKNSIFSLLLLLLITSCGTSKRLDTHNLELTFLDDYIIPEDLEIGGTIVGGLSGIEFFDGEYYLVCDHPGNPRFYKAEIPLNKRKIDTVIISEVIELREHQEFFSNNTLDLEAIRY